MKSKASFGAALSLALLGQTTLAQAANLQLIKEPGCECCSGHAAYLRAHGFEVDIVETEDLLAVKAAHGVPAALAGCHTILARGYVIEGHVPAAAIAKLLGERPAIKGLSLPGMPMGSPGMSGAKVGPFEVVTIEEGKPQIFHSE
jgi:hypothetical protein